MYGIKGCPEGDGGQRSQTGSQWGTYIGYDGAQPPHLLVLGGYIHACASATISRKKGIHCMFYQKQDSRSFFTNRGFIIVITFVQDAHLLAFIGQRSTAGTLNPMD